MSKDKVKSGPKPDTVKINTNWENAIKKALKKKPAQKKG